MIATFFHFIVQMIVLTAIAILSLPVALVSFLWAVQKNAWRFGREMFKLTMTKDGDPFQ